VFGTHSTKTNQSVRMLCHSLERASSRMSTCDVNKQVTTLSISGRDVSIGLDQASMTWMHSDIVCRCEHIDLRTFDFRFRRMLTMVMNQHT
jgi:hypothetical protein